MPAKVKLDTCCLCGRPGGNEFFFEGAMVMLCSGHYFSKTTRQELRDRKKKAGKR